jgi:Alpha galactosidase C-terminal beta sandwich domain
MKKPAQARDLWAHRDVPVSDAPTVALAAHGVALWRVK